MWPILNAISVNWLLVFIPATLVWLSVWAIAKPWRKKMSVRMLLGASALWLISGLFFFSLGPYDPHNVSGMLMFKLYGLTGVMSVVVFLLSLKRPVLRVGGR